MAGKDGEQLDFITPFACIRWTRVADTTSFGAAQEAPAVATQPSAASDIEKLVELKEAGHITEEEFTAAKKKALGL